MVAWGRKPRARAVLGTLMLLAVVASCLRLGFWQLERRAERQDLNARVAERQQQPALVGGDALADASAALYRRVALTGRYDDERSIVLPGQSYMGVPGVHLLTPLLLDGDRAVLVNRGWVPAADGATIPLDSFPTHVGGEAEAATRVNALVLPFPGDDRPARAGRPAPDTGFRRVWYRPDPEALRRQYPYALLPVTLQLPPEPGAPRYPTRLPPPALDGGPHLSYAIQWFSFAAIGLIGGFALALRSRRGPGSAPADPPAWSVAATGSEPRP